MTILGSFTILLFTAWLPAPGWCLGTESSLLEVKVDRSLLWENDSFIDAPLHEILKYLQILHAGFTLDKCWLVHPCTVWWMTISRRWILSRYLGIVTCYSPRSRHWPGWRASGHSRAWVPTSCGLRRCVLQWSIIVTLSPLHSAQSPDRLPAAELLLGLSTKFREIFTIFGEATILLAIIY